MKIAPKDIRSFLEAEFDFVHGETKPGEDNFILFTIDQQNSIWKIYSNSLLGKNLIEYNFDSIIDDLEIEINSLYDEEDDLEVEEAVEVYFDKVAERLDEGEDLDFRDYVDSNSEDNLNKEFISDDILESLALDDLVPPGFNSKLEEISAEENEERDNYS